MLARVLLGGAAVLVTGFIPNVADAYTVGENRGGPAQFRGDGCGSRDATSVTLPRKARVVIVRPRRGVLLTDASSSPVARLGHRVLVRGGRRVVLFTAVGAGDTCRFPEDFEGIGWQAKARLRVSYRVNRRVFFKSEIMGSETPVRYKPRLVLFGERSGITGVHWARWNGGVARGRGTLLYNSCSPNCADSRPQYYGVRIKLSRVRICLGRLLYTQFFFQYLGSRPSGLPPTYRQRFSC